MKFRISTRKDQLVSIITNAETLISASLTLIRASVTSRHYEGDTNKEFYPYRTKSLDR